LNRFVLDASVSLAWFLDNPVPELASRLRRELQQGALAVVPALWLLEVANGFATAERNRDLAPSFTDRCIADIEDLMVRVIDRRPAEISLRQTIAVARAFRLTAYDAVYLETARRESLPLATLDRRLAAAASSAGLEIIQ
jgi:predicted nucleic acid-binding protein